MSDNRNLNIGKDIPILGKRIAVDQGQTQKVALALQATEYMWALISYSPDGARHGVAAMGPIESFPIISNLIERAGVRVNPTDTSPIPDAS